MTTDEKQQMITMRENGATYREIGEAFGISRQRVEQIVGKARKNSVDIEKIIFKGIYEIFKNDRRMTFYSFAALCLGRNFPERKSVAKFKRWITGEDDSQIKLTNINRILAYTGMTYEEAFAKREIKYDDTGTR